MTKRPPKPRKPNLTGRNDADWRHARFYRWEVTSLAFRSLSVGARALLIELKALYNGANNGELFLSVREAASRLAVGKNYAGRCFAELRERGFIRPNRVGSFNMKADARRGSATSWVLTEYPFGNAVTGTKDFMRPRPKEASQNHSTVPLEGPSVSSGRTLGRQISGSVPPRGTLSTETAA